MPAEAGISLNGAVSGFRAGQKLLGRYRLERVLGHGGMGVVWLAHDEELDLEVALKFLPELVVNDRASLSDLKKETRRTLELTHPHIVRTYDFVQDKEVAGISMEYVDSDTLRNLRLDQPDGVFQCEQIAEWVRQLCTALQYAHTQAAIVHRDLKPANLMVNRKGHLKITDFGISRSLVESVTQMTSNGGVSGTLVYMSPQQLAGEPASPLDDIYAIGATIYELLTTRPPFYAGDITGQIHRKVPPSMAERRAALEIPVGHIPPRWEATIAACLAKEAHRRPQSALDIASQLGLTGPISLVPTQEHLPVRVPETAPVLQPSGPPTLAEGRPTAAASAVASAYPTQHPSQINIAPIGPRKINLFIAVGASFATAMFMLVGGSAVFLLRDTKPLPVTTPGHPPEPGRLSAGLSAQTAKTTGDLIVATDPPGATVQVGNVRQSGGTPFSDLAVGLHAVQVSAEGYEPVSIEVKVLADQYVKPEMVKLQRSKGTLQITSKPEGLAYEIKSRARPSEITRGTTPTAAVELPTGEYEVTVLREGWPPMARSAQVRNREEQPAVFEFLPGSISLTSEPPGATVLAGDAELGVTPLIVPDLIPGPVKYTLKLDGYDDATVEATAVGGAPIEHAVIKLMKNSSPEKSTPARRKTTRKPSSDEDDEDEERKGPGVKAKIAAPFKAVGRAVGGWFSKPTPKPKPKRR